MVAWSGIEPPNGLIATAITNRSVGLPQLPKGCTSIPSGTLLPTGLPPDRIYYFDKSWTDLYIKGIVIKHPNIYNSVLLVEIKYGIPHIKIINMINACINILSKSVGIFFPLYI
jgi:hypothetical protein